MRHITLLLIALLLSLPWLAFAGSGTSETEARVIVRFKAQADSVRAKALALRATRGEARDVAQARATALGMRRGQALTAGRSLDERTHVVFATGMTSDALARQLSADGEVELAVADGRRKIAALPNDPLFGGATTNPESSSGGFASRVIDQWYLKAPSGTPGQVVSSIDAPGAWNVSTGTASTIVAVIDTGVRPDHPDLKDKFVSLGYDFIGYGSPGSTANAMANDGDGADADASDPGDWVSLADVNSGMFGGGCEVSNSSWHGTRVSGLIGAVSNNGLGMAGVAWGVKLLPVRVLGKCGGYDSDILAGMKWAAGIPVPGVPDNPNKAKVLNMSLGGSGSCAASGTGQLYRDAISQINAAGAVIVVAAGNSAGRAVGLPANCPGVIAVAALRHVGTKVGFSSIGPEVTISAPGGNCINAGAGQPCLYPMVSTTNSGTTSPVAHDDAYTGNTASVGTSFSAPVVTGIVALMASVRPGITASEVSTLLQSTARAFPTSGGGSADNPTPPACMAPGNTDQNECYCTTSTCGAGMVDAAAAVAAALGANNASVTITLSPASGLKTGETLTLTASIAGLGAGRSISSTAWEIIDSGGIVTGFASGATTNIATVVPNAAGTFKVRVAMNDNLGTRYEQQATISVAAAQASAPTQSNSTGGGGGASNPGWLLGLMAAVLLLPIRRKP